MSSNQQGSAWCRHASQPVSRSNSSQTDPLPDTAGLTSPVRGPEAGAAEQPPAQVCMFLRDAMVAD